jgi:hypothetical protein
MMDPSNLISIMVSVSYQNLRVPAIEVSGRRAGKMVSEFILEKMNSIILDNMKKAKDAAWEYN